MYGDTNEHISACVLEELCVGDSTWRLFVPEQQSFPDRFESCPWMNCIWRDPRVTFTVVYENKCERVSWNECEGESELKQLLCHRYQLDPMDHCVMVEDEGAPPWSVETHRSFSSPVRARIEMFFVIGRLVKLPKDVVFHILSFVGQLFVPYTPTQATTLHLMPVFLGQHTVELRECRIVMDMHGMGDTLWREIWTLRYGRYFSSLETRRLKILLQGYKTKYEALIWCRAIQVLPFRMLDGKRGHYQLPRREKYGMEALTRGCAVPIEQAVHLGEHTECARLVDGSGYLVSIHDGVDGSFLHSLMTPTAFKEFKLNM